MLADGELMRRHADWPEALGELDEERLNVNGNTYRFQIYAVETINQCIALLSGLDAGERDEHDEFPAGSVNQRVRARLKDFAEKRQSFGNGKSQSNTS